MSFGGPCTVDASYLLQGCFVSAFVYLSV